MDQRLVNTKCPACNSLFREEDAVVICDTCKMPYHLSCRQKNLGCPTPGCGGLIGEKIPEGTAGNEIRTMEEAKEEDPPAVPTIEQAESSQQEEPQNVPMTVQTEFPQMEEAGDDSLPLQKKKRKKKARVFVILGVFLALLIAGGVFFGIPLFRYYSAGNALKRGDYDEAYEAYRALDDFLDSSDMAKESLYQKAEAALDEKDYDAAIYIFTQLDDYSDSWERAEKATYRKAKAAFDDGEYDTAISLFEGLGNYSDSREQALKARYSEAEAALDRGDYHSAISLFEALGDYSDSRERIYEAKYALAEKAMQDEDYLSAIDLFTEAEGYSDSADRILQAKYRLADEYRKSGEYEEAYALYSELGEYMDSTEQLFSVVLQWEEAALDFTTSREVAVSLSETVTLTPSQYEYFYQTILGRIESNNCLSFWSYYSPRALLLFEMLPSWYEDTALYIELFSISDDRNNSNLFTKYEDLMRRCWPSIALVRELAEQDNYIIAFLVGDWKTANGSYYLEFYENGDGSTHSHYNLPWVAEPSGTKYYDIRSMVYCWISEDSELLAEVYRFEIVDYDTLKVYCYKDGKTYTLYR